MSFTVPQARYSPVHAEDSRLDSSRHRRVSPSGAAPGLSDRSDAASLLAARV